MRGAVADPLLVRGIERILIVVTALVCIVLGYRLFRIVPQDHGSAGEFKAPSVSVTLRQVAPGVFFALFGAAILVWSLLSPWRGAGPNPQSCAFKPTSSPEEAVRTEMVVGVLNCLAQDRAALAALGEERAAESVAWAKTAVVAAGWQPEWGTVAERAEFVRRGATDSTVVRGLLATTDPGCRQ